MFRRWHYLIVIIFFLLTIAGSAVAMADETITASTADRATGEQLFKTRCSVCHGSEGAGGVGVPLNLPDFLKTASDVYLRKTIRLGRPGRVMPAFYTLTDHEVDSIIRHIRSWAPDIKAPVYTQDRIIGDRLKGEKIYTNICTKCHRDSGIGGKGTGVTFSRPRDAEIIAPAIGNPAFLASASDRMIKKIIMTGRHSTPMVSAKLMGLNEEDVNNVVSYLRSLTTDNIVNAVQPVDSRQNKQALLKFESSYSLEETIENIKQAAVGYNFRYIREQTLDKGFVAEGQENPDEYLIYFCNFTFLNQALSVDPRIGMFLPFRATILKKDDMVYVMTVNPDYLCSLFNNDELKQGCEFMSEKYQAMLEESTL